AWVDAPPGVAVGVEARELVTNARVGRGVDREILTQVADLTEPELVRVPPRRLPRRLTRPGIGRRLRDLVTPVGGQLVEVDRSVRQRWLHQRVHHIAARRGAAAELPGGR